MATDTHYYCENCYDISPEMMIDRGPPGCDNIREATACCDMEEVELTDSELLDIISQDMPKLIALEVNPESLKARATLNIKVAQANGISAMYGDSNCISHPKLLEPHNKRCTGDRVLREVMFYDWIEEMLMQRVNYETQNYTIYHIQLNLSEGQHMLIITWNM